MAQVISYGGIDEGNSNTSLCVTINASLVTLPVSLFGHKIKLLLFTEYIVHMS